MKRQIEQFPDFSDLVHFAAQKTIKVTQQALTSHGRVTIALAGGSTPKSLFALLSKEPFRSQMPWESLHVFWGDERHVPPNHKDSNYRMARETLLDHVPIPKAQIHRILGELPNAQEAADQYERELVEFFRPSPGTPPQFDLVFLGMGPDGHTASIFPGTSAVHDNSHFVAAPWVEKFSTFRITLTPVVLNESANVYFLVSGQDKATTLQLVLEGPFQT